MKRVAQKEKTFTQRIFLFDDTRTNIYIFCLSPLSLFYYFIIFFCFLLSDYQSEKKKMKTKFVKSDMIKYKIIIIYIFCVVSSCSPSSLENKMIVSKLHILEAWKKNIEKSSGKENGNRNKTQIICINFWWCFTSIRCCFTSMSIPPEKWKIFNNEEKIEFALRFFPKKK